MEPIETGPFTFYPFGIARLDSYIHIQFGVGYVCDTAYTSCILDIESWAYVVDEVI